MRHKWKWGQGGMSAVCERCGATRKFVERKTKIGTYGYTMDNIVTLKNGETVIVAGKTKMPQCVAMNDQKQNREKMRLRFGEWSWFNPLYEPLEKARWKARYDYNNLTREDALLLASVADDYTHIVAHPTSTSSIISQLRKVRRAVKRVRDE